MPSEFDYPSGLTSAQQIATFRRCAGEILAKASGAYIDPVWSDFVDETDEILELFRGLIASRQPSAVSDEEVEAFVHLYLEETGYPLRRNRTRLALEQFCENRAALTPVQVPEIPEGWQLLMIFYQAGSYRCTLCPSTNPHWPYASASGPTWQAALAAACQQAQEGKK